MSERPFHIRPARVDDAAALAAVHVQAWRDAYRGVVADEALAALDVAQRRAMWERALARSDGRVLVAESAESAESAIMGFASVGNSRDGDMAGAGELYAIYVAASQWGAGAGHALLVEAERALAALGFSEAALWVLDENPRARRFYESHGWSVDGASRVVSADSAAAGLVELRYRRALG